MIIRRLFSISIQSGFIFLVASIFSCSAPRLYVSDSAQQINEDLRPNYTVFLIGDAGEPELTGDPIFKMLQKQITESGPNSSLVYLGDNLYPVGLPKENDPKREESEAKLLVQLDALKGYLGKSYFIPGNHDWGQGAEDGVEAVRRQENFVEGYEGAQIAFLPDQGCPGPIVQELTDDLVLIIIDTQWWLHKHQKPTSECDFGTDENFIGAIRKAVDEHQASEVLVVAHHPLFSNGSHGGRYPLKDHIFPLANLKKGLYIPLPVIGSIYPGYRKFLGNIQDIPNPRYQALKEELLKAFEGHERLIYAAGHEHNLQHFEKQGQHFIVTGAGSKQTYAAKKRGASMTYSGKGFARIDYFESDRPIATFWGIDEEDKPRMIYRIRLD